MISSEELEAVLQGDSILTHDDMLVIRGQKHTAGMEDHWRQFMARTDTCTGWYNPDTGESHGKGWEPSPEDIRNGWKQKWEWGRDLSPTVRIAAWDSTLDIRMRNLWEDMRRRYRMQLEAVVTAEARGILSYKGKHELGSRERQEAIRHRLRKHWRVALYEHDLLIKGEIADLLMRELQEYADRAGLKQEENTVYLKGYDGTSRKAKPLMVKAYRCSKHELPEVAKIEVSFRSDYLKRNGMRDPAVWERQPDLQERLKESLKREWRQIMEHAPETKKRLARELRTTQRELFDTLAGSRNTLSERVAALERESRQARKEREELRQRMAELEGDRLTRDREW